MEPTLRREVSGFRLNALFCRGERTILPISRPAVLARGMLVDVTTVTLSEAQFDRARALCTAIRSRPGMWIAHFDWFTVDAFWTGYLSALHEDAMGDFRTWGLAYLGAPESNTDPIFQLRRVHGQPTDHAGDAAFGRARATEIAGLVCDVVEAYLSARRGS